GRAGIHLADRSRRRCQLEPVRRECCAASIGRAFDSSQTTLDLIAVGYSLGLAAYVCGHRLPDQGGGDHSAVVWAGAYQSHRVVSATGCGIAALGPLVAGGLL